MEHECPHCHRTIPDLHQQHAGAAKSPAKAAAARANGKKGGRPRKDSITNCVENNNVPSACTHFRKV
jgi:hypothetical protein